MASNTEPRMDTDKDYVERVEYAQPTLSVVQEQKFPSLEAVLAVLAVNAMAFAQIISIVGSGLLANQTTAFLGDASKASWLSTALTLFTLALNPPLSQAADYWGRKWIMITTAVGGLAGSIIISRAQNVDALIGGFCVLGLSFGSQSLFFTVVSEIVPRRVRAGAQATINVTSGVGSIVGLLMGGGLLKGKDNANYRIYWYVVAGLFLFAIVGMVVGYNPPSRRLESSLTTKQKLASLDWIGYFLLIGALTTLVLALQWSDNPYKWADADPHIIGPFIVAIVLLGVFGMYEWKVKDGMLHHSLFGDRNFVISITTIFVEGLAYFTTNSYYAFEVQVMTQTNLFDAGLRYSIMSFATGMFAMAVGAYTTWTRQLREPLIFGFVMLTLFNCLMCTITEHTPKNVFWGYPVVGGVGLGVLLTNLTVITQMSTPPERVAMATGISIAARSLGATVALSINAAVFNDAVSSNVGSKVASAVLPLGYPPEQLQVLVRAFMSGDSAAVGSLSNATPQVLQAAGAAMLSAYAASFQKVWICAAAFSATGLIIAFFLRNVKSEFTSHIDAPIVARPSQDELSKHA